MKSEHSTYPIAAYLAFCIEEMVRRGLDRDELLDAAGLDENRFFQPETRLTVRQELAVYTRIRRLVGAAKFDELGLTLGAEITINCAGMLGGLAANARNLGHAGYLLRRFHLLSNRWFAAELIGALVHGRTVVRYRHTANLKTLHRFMLDLSVRSTHQLLVEIFGLSACGYYSEIAFGYTKPKNSALYSAAFNCPVSFDHDCTYVTFNDAAGTLINPKHSEYAYHLYLQHCRDTVLRFDPVSWTQKVLNCLSRIDTYPSSGSMSETLNCSERSLRRHLNNEGAQYSELIDRVRLDRAVYLLSHSSNSIKQIGYQLAYSEPAAFIHAFARWTGSAPSSFRRAIGRSDQPE